MTGTWKIYIIPLNLTQEAKQKKGEREGGKTDSNNPLTPPKKKRKKKRRISEMHQILPTIPLLSSLTLLLGLSSLDFIELSCKNMQLSPCRHPLAVLKKAQGF